MNDNNIEKIQRDFKRKMQKLVDKKNSSIRSISIEGDGKKYTIAERKKDE